MRLITDIFTRAEVSGASREFTGRRLPPKAEAAGNVVCVHFTGAARDHSVWLADDPDTESVTDGLTVSWQRVSDGVLRGRVGLHGAVADVLVVGRHGIGNGHRMLRELGLSRAHAAALAPWAGRPIVATFSHGPALSPETQRRVHRALLASLARWDRLVVQASSLRVA